MLLGDTGNSADVSIGPPSEIGVSSVLAPVKQCSRGVADSILLCKFRNVTRRRRVEG